MSKDLISSARIVNLVNNAATSNAEGQSATAVDIGHGRYGTLILTVNWTSDAGPTEIGVYSEEDSTITEIAGSRIKITQDTVNSTSTTVQTTANVIDEITEDGIFIYHVQDLKRYVTIFWDGDDANTVWTANLVVHDQEYNPYAAAKTAY